MVGNHWQEEQDPEALTSWREPLAHSLKLQRSWGEVEILIGHPRSVKRMR